MASGNKTMVLNARERVVSDDWNRMQRFVGAQVADAIRWLMLTVQLESGATSLNIQTTLNPLWGVILNGLEARPEIGTVNLFVNPGVIAMINPDASPSSDDSPAKVFYDAGQPLAGALTLTPGSVATRIDVIECSRVDVVTQSDNRDVFDPVTGLFTAVLVDKVKTSQLVFRIRTGTAGGGFASVGTAAGWMPIAVASVPSTATTWDDVTLWDVRRLMADMVRSPAQLQQKFPHVRKAWATMFELGGVRTARGVIETELDQYLMGGQLGSNFSGLANGALDLLSTSVLEPGFAVSNDLPWILYLLTPFGLPRWAKYTPATAGIRIPDALKGIPVFTQKTPANHGGNPGVAVSLPTGTGLGGSTTKGVVALTGIFNGANFANGVLADHWTRLVGPAISPASGAGSGSVRYDLIDGTHWPTGATAVRLRFATRLAAAAGTAITGTREVILTDGAGNVVFSDLQGVVFLSPTAGAINEFIEVDVPLHDLLTAMPNGSPITRQILLTHTVATFTFSVQSVRVVGWRMGM